MMQVVGRPGAHARKLAQQATGKATLSSAGVIVGIVIILAGFNSAIGGSTAGRFVVVIGLGLGIASYVIASAAWKKRGRAAIGAQSEKQVANALRKMRPSAGWIANGLMLGSGGDIDHIVLGHAAMVIETKTGFGPIRADSGGLWAGKRRIPGDALAQVRRGAGAVSQLLHANVLAVVCIPEGKCKPFRHNGVVVCNADGLGSVWSALHSNGLDVTQASQVLMAKAEMEAR